MNYERLLIIGLVFVAIITGSIISIFVIGKQKTIEEYNANIQKLRKWNRPSPYSEDGKIAELGSVKYLTFYVNGWTGLVLCYDIIDIHGEYITYSKFFVSGWRVWVP